MYICNNKIKTNNIMKTTPLIILLYLYFKPSLDKTRNGDTLLWFWGIKREKRKYIKLW